MFGVTQLAPASATVWRAGRAAYGLYVTTPVVPPDALHLATTDDVQQASRDRCAPG
jgi:hypothetical protein